MKIINYKILFSDDCTPEYKNSIIEYWKLQNNLFVNKPSDLATELDLEAHQLSKIVAELSTLEFEILCEMCKKINTISVKSQASFNNIKSKIKKEHPYICDTCAFDIRQAELLAIEKEKLKKIEKQKSAIENKSWKSLKYFEQKVLHNILHTKNIKMLLKLYKDTPNSIIWNAIYKIRDVDLIELHQFSEGSSVYKITHHNDLKGSFAIEEPAKPKATYDVQTNELKFRLTKNEFPKDIDSPIYSGILNFPNEITLQANIDYIFGGWRRSNNELYLTITPIDQLYKAPQQKLISKQPQHIQESIQKFLKQLNKKI